MKTSVIFVLLVLGIFAYSQQPTPDAYGRLEVRGPEGYVRVDPTSTATAFISNSAPSDISVRVSLDRSSYRVGDNAHVYVSPSRNSYVWVFSIGSDGSVTQIFPNSFERDNYLAGNGTKVIPQAGYSLKVTGPTGVDRVVAVASTSSRLDLSRVTSYINSTAVFPSYSGSLQSFGSELLGRLQVSGPSPVSQRLWNSSTASYTITH